MFFVSLCSQERTAFIFCVEDRSLFCRDCDEAIHVAGSLSGNHRRYLATGIRVALSSMCNKDSGKGHYEPPDQNFTLLDPKIPTTQESPSSFIPSAWAVDEFLQLSDYESGDKVRSRGCKISYMSTRLNYLGSPQYDWIFFISMNLQKRSPGGFGGLELFADIGPFHEQVPKGTLTAAEVPELPTQQASNAAFCGNSKVGRSNKKPRIEISYEEECFTVPDLG